MITFNKALLSLLCLFQDVYVLAALIFLGIQAAQNSCMNAFVHFLSAEEVKYYDRWSMVGLASLLIFFHIGFGFYIYKTVSHSREKRIKCF